MERHIYRVTSFRIVGPYTLKVRFDDETVQTVNLEPILHGELFGPLRDPKVFCDVRLDAEFGTLVWPNDADLDPATLHDWPECEEAMRKMARSWAKADCPAMVAEAKTKYGVSGSKGD